MHPVGCAISLIVVDDLTVAPVAVIAATQAFSEVTGLEHVPVMSIDEELTVLLVIRSVQGHSISGLRPLLRSVILFLNMVGKPPDLYPT